MPGRSLSARRRRAIPVLAVAAALVLTACGSGATGAGGSGGGLPATVNILAIHDESGLASYAAVFQDKGMKLAIKEINEQHFLGSTQLTTSVQDTAFSPQNAAALMSQAGADKNVTVVQGPLNSGEAAAMSPLAQKFKLPILLQTAGSGVITGPYSFGSQAPQSAFFPKTMDTLKAKGVKTISVVYSNASDVYNGLATKTVADYASANGMTILSSTSVPLNATDFTAPVAKIVGEKPDAVVVLLLSGPTVAVIQSLRQNGYAGPIGTSYTAANGALKKVGTAGNGVAWTTDFTAVSSSPDATKFVSAYKAEYNGEVPANFAAVSYDSTWWIARALKASGDASREGVKNGLTQVARSGFTGAQGALTFDVTNTLQVTGTTVEWTGGGEKLVAAAG